MTVKFIPAGKHAVIVGQNGSGKSQQLISLALNNRQRVVILDTKLDDDFLYLAVGNEVLQVADSYPKMIELLNNAEFHYLIVRPQADEMTDPIALDNYLVSLSKCKNISIFIDEAYPFHVSGRAGPGYVSVLTRGRSRGLSLIACTQRPVWVSVFTFSESKYFFIYYLSTDKDRKTIEDYIGRQDFDNLKKYWYYFYTTESKNVILSQPVELFRRELYGKRQGSKSIFSIIFNRG